MGSFNFTSFYNSFYSKTILNQIPSQPSTSCATLGILEILFFPTEGTIRLSLTRVPIHVIRHFRFCMDNQTPLSIYSSSLPRLTPFYNLPLQTFHHIGFFHTAKNYIILISILSISTLLITWPFRYFPLLHCFPQQQQQQKTVPPSSSLPIRQFTSYHVQIQAFNPITFFSTARTIIFISILLCALYLYLYSFFAVNAISCSNIYI